MLDGKHTEEEKQRISLSLKGHASWNKGKHFPHRKPSSLRGTKRPIEFGKKVSLALKGRKKSAQHILNIIASKKGKKLSEEHKKKIGLSGKGRKHSEETKRKIGLKSKGRIKSPETIEKQRAAMKGKLAGENNPFYGKKHTEGTIAKIILAHKGISWGHHTVETREKQSKTHKGRPSSLRGTKFTPEHCNRISQSLSNRWNNDPEFVRMMVHKKHSRPTAPERALDGLLSSVCPGQYKYTGDGTFSIGKYVPDFINCNGQKKAIEMYGTYWHRNDNPQDRIDKYAEYSYSCLVIWQHELKNKEAVITRLKEFNEVSP